ncbi:acyl-CoA thioesterase [Xanthovirga aplysinae]|uniref:acyl-CoA thioesterase n=1 Tax=Xanthovirga aplysinae TaxID=2529853 RepID=UPI0012BD1FE1|nr:acyl-CoA thioesterase [Xanthovirga aplysinae]MTI30931.1 thioesterase [Xanthovirga aplysinae]
MNLYFRLFFILIKGWFVNRLPQLHVWRTSFIVLPWDCDLNFHLTNSRYLSFADLARTEVIIRLGLLRKTLRRKWAMVVSAQNITYIRPVPPLAQLEMETEILCWDEKYFYFEHRYKVKEKLYAVSLVRGAFIKGKEVIPFHKVAELIGIQQLSPRRPEKVKQLMELLAKKKVTVPTNEFSSNGKTKVF